MGSKDKDGYKDNAMILEKERSMPEVEEQKKYQSKKEIDILNLLDKDPHSLTDEELSALISYKNRKLDRLAECGTKQRVKEPPKPKPQQTVKKEIEEVQPQQPEEHNPTSSTKDPS